MTDMLSKLYAAKAVVRAADEAREPLDALRERAERRRAERRGFRAALAAATGPAIVAEIKRASPSVGLIVPHLDPAAIAREYEQAGADAISVLTESDHFLGDLAYVDVARAASSLPILRKDFLSSRYEVVQSAAYGADAILAIVAGLSDACIAEIMEEARLYGLDVLVEVHTEDELARAVERGRDAARDQQPQPSFVRNRPRRHRGAAAARARRDDRHQRERREVAGRRAPARRARCARRARWRVTHARRRQEPGDPRAQRRCGLRLKQALRTRVKICGCTSVADVAIAVEAGADAVGVILAERSERRVSIERFRDIAQSVPALTTLVAVFVDPPASLVDEALHAGAVPQFHGDEPAEACESVAAGPYLKAFHVEANRAYDPAAFARFAQPFEHATWMFDTAADDGRSGGTGRTFTWELARRPRGRATVRRERRADTRKRRCVRACGAAVCRRRAQRRRNERYERS